MLSPLQSLIIRSCLCLPQSSLELRERIAFACRFLPDIQLIQFIDRCSAIALESGNLDGLMLTGLGAQGIDLIQSYLDRTGDVQTAALLACFSTALAFPQLVSWIIAAPRQMACC